MSDLTYPMIAFCDGACSGNPGPGGWGSIIVHTQLGEVVELGGRANPVTNNQMELRAVIEVLKTLAREEGKIALYTDSTYVIRGITQWIWAWRAKDWKTAEGKEVSNQDLWKTLFALVSARGKKNAVEWKYVRGHTGVPGNEREDEIAVAFSQSASVHLYRGPLTRYPVAVLDLPENPELPEMRSREDAKTKKQAYSYLSLVNGKLERHLTWKECEACVKGRPGARFKKALSPEDEKRILAEWGFSPSPF